MNTHIYVVFVALLIACTWLVRASPCSQLPVTISNIAQCHDGLCSMDIMASSTLDLTDKTSCINLVAGDEGQLIATVNVSLVNAFSTQNFESCYYTDYIYVDTKLSCACSTELEEATCSESCTAQPRYTDNVVCNDFPMFVESSCTFGWAKNCIKTGFSGVKKYKVCKLKPKGLSRATVKIDTSQDTLYLNFENGFKVFETYDSSGSMNFTNKQFILKEKDDVEYVVMPLDVASDFFIGTKDLVNDYNEYDPNKIGWYKVGHPQPINVDMVKQAVSIRSLTECNGASSTYQIAQNWKLVGEITNANTQRWASTILPGSYIDDEEWMNAVVRKENWWLTTANGFWELKDGFFGYQYLQTSSLSLVGKGFDGNYIPTQFKTFTTDKLLRTQSRELVSAKWNIHCSISWLGYSSSQGTCGEICVAELPSLPNYYGYCYKKNCDNSMDYICDNFENITALHWPSTQWVSYTFKDKMIATWPEVDDSKSNLYYPVPQAMLSYTMSLKNTYIKFTSSDVKPKIVSCVGNSTAVTLKLRSDGANGNVLVTPSHQNNMYATKIWYLRNTEQDFIYTLGDVQGNFTFTVMNADSSTSCVVNMNAESLIDFSWNNITGLPYNWWDLLNGKPRGTTSPTASSVSFWFVFVGGGIFSVAVMVAIVVLCVLAAMSCCGNEKKQDGAKKAATNLLNNKSSVSSLDREDLLKQLLVELSKQKQE